MKALCRPVVEARAAALHCYTLRRYASQAPSSLQYCVDSVRQFDYENYLSTLLLGNSLRRSAFVVRAFNIEVARVQDQTSDNKIGLMRLQFWSDTLENIYSPQDNIFPAHPVAQELQKVCNKYNVSRRYFNRIVNCRKANISKKYYETLEDMEKYSEESVSPIYYILLEIAGQKNVHCDHAASHLGKAQGLTNMLRSVEILTNKRSIMLPLDLLIKHNVSQENVLRLSDTQNIKKVVFEFASRANQHLTKARSISIPQEARSILLPAVAVDSYLKKLQKCHFNLFDKRVKERNSLLPFTLYWNKLLSKF